MDNAAEMTDALALRADSLIEDLTSMIHSIERLLCLRLRSRGRGLDLVTKGIGVLGGKRAAVASPNPSTLFSKKPLTTLSGILGFLNGLRKVKRK